MMATENMNTMPTLAQLFSDLSLDASVGQQIITGLTIDSREVKPGYLFVAVQGLRCHGKDFLDQATAKGAVAVLIDADENITAAIPVVSLPNMEKQLSRIAGDFYGQPSYNIPVIGITGTNGKTTCSQLLAQSFAHLHVDCGVIGTLGYGVISKEYVNQSNEISSALTQTGMTTTDPITTQKICAELLAKEAGVIAMEVSSHGLSQYRVSDVFIRTAVFTNLTHDHLDYHGTMAAYGEAKAKLFAMPSVTSAVVNVDDEYSHRIIEQLRPGVELVSYSVESCDTNLIPSSAHFSIKAIAVNDRGTEAVLVTPEGNFPIKTTLVGRFNMSNLLAVVATLYINHYPLSSIVQCLPLLKPVSGRMEIIPNQAGIQVLIDYAHTPDALKNVLASLAVYAKGTVWCVFGCGGDRDREKRPEMAAIAEAFADEVVLTNDNPRTESPAQIFADIEAGFSSAHHVIDDRAAAIDFAIRHANKGDVVLIAGKGHEDYQIIGQQRLAFSDHNEARLSLRRREQGG